MMGDRRDDAAVPTAAPEGVDVMEALDRGLMDGVWSLRRQVFIEEQQVPPHEEFDEADTAPTTRHVAAVLRAEPGTVVGTGRLVWDAPGAAHIGRMAVAQTQRGRGVGRAVIRELERIARVTAAGEPVRLELSAQEHALGFYESLGYQVEDGPRYLDAGIWHRSMARQLEADGA